MCYQWTETVLEQSQIVEHIETFVVMLLLNISSGCDGNIKNQCECHGKQHHFQRAH